jgi:hypothetical protein
VYPFLLVFLLIQQDMPFLHSCRTPELNIALVFIDNLEPKKLIFALAILNNFSHSQ